MYFSFVNAFSIFPLLPVLDVPLELDPTSLLTPLHSHTHPYLLKNLSKFNQNQEYKKNKSILSKISNTKIFSMSHPCGSYNKDSIQILKKLNIDIGFKSSLIFDHKKKQINLSNLEIAREDHTNILNMIK